MEMDQLGRLALGLILIVVVVLAVYGFMPIPNNFVRELGDDIIKIGKEVFGFDDQALREEQDKKAKKMLQVFAAGLREAIAGEEGCISNVGLSKRLPIATRYDMLLEDVAGKNKITIYDEEKVIIASEDIDKVQLCYMTGPTKDNFEILDKLKMSQADEGLAISIKRGFDAHFYPSLPEFYKLKKGRVCFLTDKLNKEEREYFKKVDKACKKPAEKADAS